MPRLCEIGHADAGIDGGLSVGFNFLNVGAGGMGRVVPDAE